MNLLSKKANLTFFLFNLLICSGANAQGLSPYEVDNLAGLRARCEAYGAQPGSDAFYQCMSELDKPNVQDAQVADATALCDKNTWQFQTQCLQGNTDSSRWFPCEQEAMANCKRAAVERYRH